MNTTSTRSSTAITSKLDLDIQTLVSVHLSCQVWPRVNLFIVVLPFSKNQALNKSSNIPLFQITQPDVLDQTAVDVAKATEKYAGYASHDKHGTLQTCVVAINSVVDVKIRKVMSGQDLDQGPDEIIKIMGPLLSTTHDLTIRPVAYPSALVILKTAQKLAMLLEMVQVPENFEETRNEWAKAIKELRKSNKKWARLNGLPGSLVRLVHTELDLLVMSIPDPKVTSGWK